jgi:Flp pilus assembly secretin CpaC
VYLTATVFQIRSDLVPVLGLERDPKAAGLGIFGVCSADEAKWVTRAVRGLREVGYAKILTEPKVTTISGRPAEFAVGREFAVPRPEGKTGFELDGLRVNVVPIVLGNGKLHVETEVEVSESAPRVGNEVVYVSRNTARVHSTTEVQPGQVVTVGLKNVSPPPAGAKQSPEHANMTNVVLITAEVVRPE